MVGPNRISSQLPVSDLSEWQWQTSHFVTFCHILSHFWEGYLRTEFFGEYSKSEYYRILHTKHTVGWTKYQGNFLIRSVQERQGRRGCKSDTAQVSRLMTAETQGQYRCQAVRGSIFYTMYTFTEWLVVDPYFAEFGPHHVVDWEDCHTFPNSHVGKQTCM